MVWLTVTAHSESQALLQVRQKQPWRLSTLGQLPPSLRKAVSTPTNTHPINSMVGEVPQSKKSPGVLQKGLEFRLRDDSYEALGHTTMKGRCYRQRKCYLKGPVAVTSFEGARSRWEKSHYLLWCNLPKCGKKKKKAWLQSVQVCRAKKALAINIIHKELPNQWYSFSHWWTCKGERGGGERQF